MLLLPFRERIILARLTWGSAEATPPQALMSVAVGDKGGMGAAEPENEKYKSGYAMMLQMSGMLLTVTGDAKAAIANGQKASAIFESLIATDPKSAKYENALMQGLVTMRFPLLDEGRNAEAVANARRVVLTMEKQSADDPANAQFTRSLSVSYNSLGASLLRSGDAEVAIENHRRSLAIVKVLRPVIRAAWNLDAIFL